MQHIIVMYNVVAHNKGVLMGIITHFCSSNEIYKQNAVEYSY